MPHLAFAEARNHMVDSQVRPNKVNDPRILEAMRSCRASGSCRRHWRALAYADEDVTLGNGRVLMQPMVIARLVQLAAVVAGERALVVAAGCGYGAALLAACGVRVTALEEDAALLALARPALADWRRASAWCPARWRRAGRPARHTSVILIEGAVRAIPPAIGEQLRKETGRLVTVCTVAAPAGQAVLAEATRAGLRMQPKFDCATPAIPGLAAGSRLRVLTGVRRRGRKALASGSVLWHMIG